MSNPVQQAIESRISTNHYNPDRPLSDEVIESLVTQATRAPSAYNFQNWRFIAVRSSQAKARLKSVAYGQQKVVDASVVFIICGAREDGRTESDLEQVANVAIGLAFGVFLESLRQPLPDNRAGVPVSLERS